MTSTVLLNAMHVMCECVVQVGDYAESLQQGKEEVGDFAEVCDISGNCSHVRRDHSEDLSTLKADELITLLGGLGTSG